MMHLFFCNRTAAAVVRSHCVRSAHASRPLPSVLALATLAVCAIPSAQAEAALPTPASNSMGEVVVTATRSAQALTETLGDISIIDNETLERSSASGLADVLAQLPGVELARNGGPGTTTSVFLRGADSRFTAVYIDGVRVDSQSGAGGASWEAIPLSMIDRVEVLRGPAAAVYGSDAVAGVIQVFTKKGEASAKTGAGISSAPYLSLGAGNQRTWKAQAGVSGAGDSVDYALSVAREISQGFNATTKASSNPDRDGYASTSAHSRMGWQINTAHRIEGTLLYNDSHSGYDTSTADDRSLHRLRALGLNWQAQWSTHYTTRVTLTDTQDRYETTPSPYLADTRLRGYVFQNEWRWAGHQLSATLERREDALENSPIDRSRAQNALALGYGLRWGAHTLQINARHDEDSEFGGKSTGSAAYGYTFTPHWRMTAAAGTAFRAPTLYQRFSQYGEASLQPENGHNVELGLQWQAQAHRFSATLYRNRVSNLINWVGGSGTCAGNSGAWGGCYANVGQARYEGITLAANTRLGAWQWRATLDVQDPQNLSNGKQLARRAKQHGTLGTHTLWAGWTLGGEMQASGRRYDDANNTKRLGGYAVVNLHASTRLGPDYHLMARIDNLTDKTYELARGYATAGRTLYVGVKWAPQR